MFIVVVLSGEQLFEFHVFGGAPRICSVRQKTTSPGTRPFRDIPRHAVLKAKEPRRRKAGGSPEYGTSHRQSQPVAAYPAGTTCDQGAEMSVLCVILEEADLRTALSGTPDIRFPAIVILARIAQAPPAPVLAPHGDQDNQQGRHRHPEQQHKKIHLRCGRFESIFYCPYIDLAIN